MHATSPYRTKLNGCFDVFTLLVSAQHENASRLINCVQVVVALKMHFHGTSIKYANCMHKHFTLKCGVGVSGSSSHSMRRGGGKRNMANCNTLTFRSRTCVIKNNSSSRNSEHAIIPPYYGNSNSSGGGNSYPWTLNRRQHNVFRTHRPNGHINGGKVSRCSQSSCSNL